MKLKAYLELTQKTYRVFAAENGFDVAQVHRWASGKRSPSVAQIAEIRKATNGQVTFDDFIGEAGEAA